MTREIIPPITFNPPKMYMITRLVEKAVKVSLYCENSAHNGRQTDPLLVRPNWSLQLSVAVSP